MPPQPTESFTPVTTADSCPWYQPLCKVTPVSKYLAMAIFILMPFVGGYIGYQLAPEKVVEVPVTVMQNKMPATEVSMDTPNKTDSDSLQIISCDQGTENIEDLSSSSIKAVYDSYKGGEGNYNNAALQKLISGNGAATEIGFHCLLNDGSSLVTVFSGSANALSIVRLKDSLVTNEASAKIEQFSSDGVITPQFSRTTINFSGHILDACYDLSQNFRFDLSSFTLELVNKTGGDMPNCKANI